MRHRHHYLTLSMNYAYQLHQFKQACCSVGRTINEMRTARASHVDTYAISMLPTAVTFACWETLIEQGNTRANANGPPSSESINVTRE